MKTFEVGPIRVLDASITEIVELLAAAAETARRPTVAFALHVGALNLLGNDDFVDAIRVADYVYADGASIVLVGRASGARKVSRSPTTDIGPAIIRRASDRLSRPTRIGLIGGPPGLAKSAAEALEGMLKCNAVYVADGYTATLGAHLDALTECNPDIVFVGMGMPKEAVEVASVVDAFPPCLIMTCGGWFGFLAGDEARAPAALRKSGLEWIWRLGQSPRRLAARYALGLAQTVWLTARAVKVRLRTAK